MRHGNYSAEQGTPNKVLILNDVRLNLRVAAAVLIRFYTQSAREMGEGFSALDVALSLYNTGDPGTGFQNGYVANVYAHSDRPKPLLAH